MPNPRLYPKLSNRAIVQSKGFDPSVPSPLSQAYSRRMIEQQVADQKLKDMKLSPLDKAVAGLEAVAMAGSAMFEAIQQAPKLLQGEDAYAQAIGNRMYMPRKQPEKAMEYLGNTIDFIDQLQTDYKLPPIMPELAGLAPLMTAANQQATQNVKRGALQAGTAVERALDKPVTDVMNRGGFGAQMLGSFNTPPAQVIKPKGGNWRTSNMNGGLDKSLESLKTSTVAGETPAERIPKHEALLNDPTLNQDQLDRVRYQLDQAKGEAAVDKWIESNVANYIKKDMATPTDPVRLMMDKRAQEIEAQFQVDMNRAQRTRARAETETDPRRQANMMRQAQREEEQAKFDKDFAMQHVSHLPPYEWLNDPKTTSYLLHKREEQGFSPEGEAISAPAKLWEKISDESIDIMNAGEINRQKQLMIDAQNADRALADKGSEIVAKYRKALEDSGKLNTDQIDTLVMKTQVNEMANFLGDTEYLPMKEQANEAISKISSSLWGAGNQNPWIEKLPPETNIYSANVFDLGLDHVVDVIRQDVAAGRIRPEQLNKLTMDQAIKRTAEFNMEQAKKMQETAIKQTEGFPTYKEYPEEGYKWIELKMPDYNSLPLEERKQMIARLTEEARQKGLTPEDYIVKYPESQLVEALKYEGDTMGHCVGGYCPDVLSGRSRIFSLRDKRGEPHVTIEVQPMRGSELGRYAADLPEGEDVAAMKNPPSRIVQIKGKQNAAPKADYLPYVQDFVRSGQWSHVGDFQNTGLHKLGSEYFTLPEAEAKFKPKIQEALNFLETHPSLEEHRLAQKADDAYRGDIFGPEYDELNRAAGRSITPNVPYTYRELKALLTSPEDWTDRGETIYTPISRALEKISEARKELGIVDEPPVEGMKAGGSVNISDNPDTMMMELEDQKFQVGGIVDKAVRLAKAAKAAEMKQAMKASEALAKIEGKRLNITQADRTKVGQGFLGGPGFSGLQLKEGPHKDVGAVWGVKNVGTAKTMLGGFKDPLGKEYFTTMIGSPTQHQSNQMVFDKLYNQFKAEAKKGNLDPELRDKINARLAAAVDKDGNPIFPADVDILDKNFKKQATTFDQRAIAGNVIGGTGVGGKKGQIIDYDKIIRETTDPFLLDAPSGSLGYRLWTPSGEIIERPDLHPAFPAIATGEDLGLEFTPAAQDILMEPWVKNIRETKGRNPGYMDWTRGRPPSVEVTEDILTNLQKSGNKAGGLITVKRKAGGGIIKKAIKAAGKAAEAVAPATKRLEMSFKDVTKPVPELTEAAQRLKAGKLSREEYEALVNQHKPVTPYNFVPQPATAEDATRALNSAKREKFGKTKDIPAGTPAGLRLDIPAYKEHGVWVNSVHPEDMPTAYTNVSSVTNAEMIMPEDKALSVATREANKSPFAVIKGGWNPINEEEAVARATEYLNHPDWVQVGIDPERHGYYYNRATMEPIVRAEEVIQIGPLVLAKKPVTAPKEAFKYARGGSVNANDLILTERPL